MEDEPISVNCDEGFDCWGCEAIAENVTASATSRAQEEAWNDFIRKNNIAFDEIWLWQYWRDESRSKSVINKKIMSMFTSQVSLQAQVKVLIRRGVPDNLRKHVWWACSGGRQKMEGAPPEGQYNALCERADLELDDTEVSDDIEKDVNRTYPGNKVLGSTENIQAMRRVLRAFAVRNTEIGYCQSMNFLCALLTHYLPEEQAFWAFCGLIEDIAPAEYYSRSMIGSRIDQCVFESCIAWKLPKIHKHLKNINAFLEPITCPWFLCQFTTTLPMACACRVWDCLLWEGNVVPFRIGLSMLKSCEAEILSSQDFMEVFALLRRSRISGSYDLASVVPIRKPSDYFSINRNRLSLPISPGALMGLSDNSPTDRNSLFRLSGRTSESESLSRIDTLLYHAFDKNWIKRISRGSVIKLRAKFRKILEKQHLEKLEAYGDDRAQSMSSPAQPTTRKRGNTNYRGSIHSLIAIKSLEASNDDTLGLQEVLTLYQEACGTDLANAVESSVNEYLLGDDSEDA